MLVRFPLSLIESTPVQSSALSELLLRASPVAKFVLIVLLLFSVYSWAIIITKWLWLRGAENATNHFMSRFHGGAKLTDLYSAKESSDESPLARVFMAGYGEITSQLDSAGGRVHSIDALNRVLQSATIGEVSKMERSLSWLATTANASPFIGLFGTVVGIIIAFQGLSAASGSSIQAVAPGIAEALIATAAGIAAAVPAAIFYNYFLNKIKSLTATMDRFSLELLNLVERHYVKANV
ncbi:MAG TPA: MotA/TolQ/ExbB proton channel family protein [Blastocatellia bacterium]|jgi:biopolymer transport protein TolQ|nr:MotA/TolQ/ExbB proton channel family protein [Blastocatellia bacterium]